jgi:hypothetical protein
VRDRDGFSTYIPDGEYDELTACVRRAAASFKIRRLCCSDQVRHVHANAILLRALETATTQRLRRVMALRQLMLFVFVLTLAKSALVAFLSVGAPPLTVHLVVGALVAIPARSALRLD